MSQYDALLNSDTANEQHTGSGGGSGGGFFRDVNLSMADNGHVLSGGGDYHGIFDSSGWTVATGSGDATGATQTGHSALDAVGGAVVSAASRNGLWLALAAVVVVVLILKKRKGGA